MARVDATGGDAAAANGTEGAAPSDNKSRVAFPYCVGWSDQSRRVMGASGMHATVDPAAPPEPGPPLPPVAPAVPGPPLPPAAPPEPGPPLPPVAPPLPGVALPARPPDPDPP